MSPEPAQPRASRARDAGLALALAGLTVALYWPVRGFDFLTIDDGSYVYANPHVRAGLTRAGVVWAFARSYSSNWHPLTWLSHMLDSELFRMDAGAHHLTSAVLHALGAAVLFLALRAARLGRAGAAFAAALFAWHPLRVESVAWVAERKDVLSGLLFAATLYAWARYARAGGRARYAGALALYALGLMAKPMLVSVPLVLLCLDLWPLGRAADAPGRPAVAPRRLLAEKLPFCALALASCVVTYLVQERSGAVRSLVQLSTADRVSNAITSVWAYAAKTLWPARLAAFYPHPAIVTPLEFHPWRPAVLVAAAALLASCAAALALRRRAPWLAAGWGWTLAMLLPVIGLVQVGEQALADRYTYLPGIGLALVAAGAGGAAWRARRALRLPLGLAAAAALALCAAATHAALPPWRDTEALFRRALEVTERNYVAHFNLGVTLEAQGRTDEARAQYQACLAVKPDSSDAHYNLGVLALEQGDLAGAEEHLRAAIQRRPSRAQAWVNLGVALARAGRAPEAEEALQRALALRPDAAEAWSNLARLSARAGDLAQARERFERALALDPDLPGARLELGIVLFQAGATAAASEVFEETLRREPANRNARAWLDRARSRPEGSGG